MNIVVCIKQVPDTTEVKLDPKTGTLIRDGVPSIINPDDKAGLEAALRIKDKNGSHVTVLTMGPPQADLALREALAMGADRAILLTDRAFAGADTWATSSALAGALKKMDYDLIIAGRQAIDGDTAQVGPQISEKLGIPQVTYVQKFEIKENKEVIVQRQLEDGHEMIKVKAPVLLTAVKELNQPRYMALDKIFEAYTKQIKVLGINDLDITSDQVGLMASPTRVFRSFTPDMKTAGIMIDKAPKEAALELLGHLKSKHFI